MAKTKKSASNEKNSRTSGGVCKLPAGTLKARTGAERADSPAANTPTPNHRTSVAQPYGADAPDGSGGKVQNPPVPNRAKTEM